MADDPKQGPGSGVSLALIGVVVLAGIVYWFYGRTPEPPASPPQPVEKKAAP